MAISLLAALRRMCLDLFYKKESTRSERSPLLVRRPADALSDPQYGVSPLASLRPPCPSFRLGGVVLNQGRV